jgi:hypothetical protein
MATSLLKRGQDAIVIFTHGKYFRKNRDGSGSTGNWVIDEKRKCNQVIIYNRTQRGNQVYVAKKTAVTPSKVEGRSVIQLADIEYYGTTYFNWPQFAGSRNPIRYFRIPSISRGKQRKNNDSELNIALLPPAD